MSNNNPPKAQIVLVGWGPTPSDVHRFLEERGCFDAYNKLLAIDLFSMVSRKEQATINQEIVYTGWTCSVSIPGLARRNGMSKSKVYSCVKEMEAKGAIEKRSPNNDALYQFRVMVYPPALENHKQNPDRAKQYIETPIPDVDERRKIQEEASRDYDDSELVHDMEQKSDLSPHSGTLLKVKALQEPPLTVSDSPGPNEESENRGDSLIEEKQETTDLIPVSEWVEEEAKEEKASLGKEKDVVPGKQIGEMLDSMTQSKGMGASPTDDSVEAIITAFNPQSPAISNWKHAQVASVLKGHLEGVLSAASIDMPPILFFKHCLREMENRLADGKIDTRPSSLNYFLNAATGKDIVVCALGNLKSERTAEKTVQKTDDYLQDMQEWKEANVEREIPAAAKAELDRILGRRE